MTSNILSTLRKQIRRQANPARAQLLQRYFKTGKREYAAGDIFLGLTVPKVRVIAQQFRALRLPDALCLLRSRYHEERFAALLLLTHQFTSGDAATQTRVYQAYLEHTRYINNWDLVDVSAHKIVGAYLRSRSRRPLLRLARSQLLWDRRVAIIATAAFIQLGEITDTFRIATLLLKDEHDLIHKATGWMLREAGKKDSVALRTFLQTHAVRMPRTMLRYAIERFPEPERLRYLNTARAG